MHIHPPSLCWGSEAGDPDTRCDTGKYMNVLRSLVTSRFGVNFMAQWDQKVTNDHDKDNDKYRVSQKKLSLVENSRGKYNYCEWEIQ